MSLRETLAHRLPYLYSILFLLVVITHVWLCWRVGEAHPIPKYDEAVYADLAREMVRTGAPMRRLGEEPRFYYIHPFLQTFFWSLPLYGSVPEDGLQNPAQAITNLSKLRWVTTLFSIGTLCLIFAMFFRTAPGFGLLAATLLAFNPMWLKYSHLVYLEVPCAFWVTLAVIIFYSGILLLKKGKTSEGFEIGQDSIWRDFVCGATFGAAMITKYLSLIAAIPIFYFFFRRKNKNYFFASTIGFGLVCISWPLFIFFKGSLGDWISQSIGRWTSFQTGQGGDPRTDWSILEFLRNTFGELGPIQTLVFSLSLISIPFMPVWAFVRAMNELKKPPKNRPKTILNLFDQGMVKHSTLTIRYALVVAFYFVVLLILPTKDPKFLVIVLPLAIMAASGMLRLFINDVLENEVTGIWRKPVLILLCGTLFLLAFPIDLLGLDNTRFKKLYPTDHAYTHVTLAHGQDYLPIAEDLFFRTTPGEVIPVGRQGPIVGYLADRPYQILYTENDPEAFDKRFETSRYLVIDDTWEHCFGGLQPNEVEALRLEISKEYQVIREVGHVKLLAKKL